MTRAGRNLDYSERQRDAHYLGSVRQDRCTPCLMGLGASHGLGLDKATVARCRSYFYGRGVFRYQHGKRCELTIGHNGAHRNSVDARFLDPQQGFSWGRGR